MTDRKNTKDSKSVTAVQRRYVTELQRQVALLQSENARLREALEKIALNEREVPDPQDVGSTIMEARPYDELEAIARDALAEKDRNDEL